MPTVVDAHVHVFLDGNELNAETRKRHLQKDPEALWLTARANAEAPGASALACCAMPAIRTGLMTPCATG